MANWSSLDYGGQWKLLHSMAKRFFLPVNVVAVPDPASGTIVLRGINDTGAPAGIEVEVRAVTVAGAERIVHRGPASVSPDAAQDIARIAASDLGPDEFLFVAWHDAGGRLLGENDFFPRAYKYYDLAEAVVTARWTTEQGRPVLVLKSDRPAFFVTATANVPGYFSDNAVTPLPGRETRLSFMPRQRSSSASDETMPGAKVRHLRETF